MEIEFDKELNEKQLEACTSTAHHLRIVAGAGTGKTRVLTYRIAYLITKLNVAPNRIVAITFTNKVAKEMQERVAKILDKAGLTIRIPPLISTFHGYCYRFLKREIQHLDGFNTQFSILDDDDQKSIWKIVFNDVHIPDDKEKKKYVAGLIGKAKAKGLFPKEVSESSFPPYGPVSSKDVLKAYQDYQVTLKKNNALDFDDLLMFTEKILEDCPQVRAKWQSKFDAYLVDEFQDTNGLQYKLLGLLLPPNGSLTVVGDPDQTIYTWRGADNDIITKYLPHDYRDLQTVTLDVNYRSTQAILDKANQLIRNNTNRMAKNLVSFTGEKGSDVVYTYCYSQDNEASFAVNKILSLHAKGIKYSDIAVIYRSNYLSQAFEKALTQNRIPYAVYGGLKFFDRAEVKDTLAYLRLLVNPKDDFSFKRAIKAPSVGIGDKTLAMLSQQAEGLDLSLLELVQAHLGDLPLKTAISLRLGTDLKAYQDTVKALKNAEDGTAVSTVLFQYLDKVGLIAYVQKKDSLEDKEDFDINDKDTKLKNVKELLGQINHFIDSDVFDEQGNPTKPTLEDFLIDVAIQSDQDSMVTSDKVMLMTAHVSKGLEFPYVFVVGLNDGIFPTGHALDSGSKAIEEERRLFYVAMTRAKKGLFLSSFGGYSYIANGPQIPSDFLAEIGFKPQPQSDNPFARQDYGNHDLYAQRGGGHVKVYQDNQPHSGYVPGSFAETAMKQADALLNARRNRLANAQSINNANYQVGDRIAHVSFGIGTVVGVDRSTITVQFKDPFGTKKLAKGFLKAFKKVE